MLKLVIVLIQMFQKENYAEMFLAGNRIIRLKHLTMTLIQTQKKTPNYSGKDSDPDKTESYTSEEEIVVTKTHKKLRKRSSIQNLDK